MSGRLGPLICDVCRVVAVRADTAVYAIVCPCCGNRALEYLWMYTEAEQAEIQARTRFVDFVAGNPSK